MKGIIASARIQNGDNVAVAKLKCDLELYHLKANRWGRIATEVTDTKGDWKVTVKRSVANTAYAPMLRLVESGAKPSPQVLAQHVHLKYDATKQMLSADFGVVEHLQDDAYKLMATNALFQRSSYHVAAQAQQPVQVKLDIARKINLSVGATTATVSKDTLRAATLTNTATSSPIIRTETRLNVLATNIGTEVHSANEALQKQKLPYQFGRIDLDLKGAVGSDGQSITLAHLDDGVKDTAVSNVKIALLPTRDEAVTQDTVVVPDVSGLTEGVVRRLLNSVGLRLEAVNQTVGDDSKIAVGQSMRQAPKAGESLPRNNSVLVVFAST
jgi:hypothetical protein